MESRDSHDLVKYRIEQAYECLIASEAIMATSYKTSLNRSYYAIFHALRAVLALDNLDILSYFKENTPRKEKEVV